MKRTILIVLGLAALAAPVARAGAPSHLSPVQRIVLQESRGGRVSTKAPPVAVSPVTRIIAQEDARQNDPAVYGGGPAAQPVQIVDTGGFHWADAGIGAAVVAAAMLVLAGTMLALRAKHPSRA